MSWLTLASTHGRPQQTWILMAWLMDPEEFHWTIMKNRQILITYCDTGTPPLRNHAVSLLALPTSDHRVSGSNPAAGEVLSKQNAFKLHVPSIILIWLK